jgi:hypothetical protein
LLCTLVLILGVYLALKFVPPYWTYLSMQDPVKEAALALVRPGADEAKVRANLISRAADQGLAITDDSILIDQEGPLLVVRLTWTASVDLPGVRYRIPFRIESRVPQR